MNPNKVSRENLGKLTDLPNIGKAGAKDLILLGILKPAQLVGKYQYELYDSLCFITVKATICVLLMFSYLLIAL